MTGHCFIQLTKKFVSICIGSKATFLPFIGAPVYLRLINRTYIPDIITFVRKVLSCQRQKISKVCKLILLQVDLLFVGCKGRTTPCHKIGGRISKEQKVIDSPFLCSFHKPLLPCMFGKIVRTVR